MTAMKTLILVLTTTLAALAARGQGQFLFNTHDSSIGNDVRFYWSDGTPVSGSDTFVEVLAGPDAQHLTQLTPLLSLNRGSAAGAGYTNPFGLIFSTTTPGDTAFVGYRMFQGTSWDAASVKSPLITTQLGSTPAPLVVALTSPPSLPNELSLGSGSIYIPLPEPAAWTLIALGLGAGLLIRRLKA
jgi:hypothetical protein